LTIEVLCGALDLVRDSFNLGLGVADNAAKSFLCLSAYVPGRPSDPILIHNFSPLICAYFNAAQANWFTGHDAARV
jgi:hypothetical protein